MDWLNDFARKQKKTPDYAQRVLDGYRRGIRAGGAIAGVRVLVGEDCCDAAKALAGQVFSIDEVPLLPLEGCPYGEDCRCAYRPVMKNEVEEA